MRWRQETNNFTNLHGPRLGTLVALAFARLIIIYGPALAGTGITSSREIGCKRCVLFCTAPGSTPSPHFTNSSRSTPESSLNPIVPHAESQQPYQVSSPFPSNHTRFVFPSSSVSCNYEADYTGGTGGTGDSGVGDTFSNHIPSKEALRRKLYQSWT